MILQLFSKTCIYAGVSLGTAGPESPVDEQMRRGVKSFSPALEDGKPAVVFAVEG